MPVCPHCGFEADAGSSACPLCGSPLEAAERSAFESSGSGYAAEADRVGEAGYASGASGTGGAGTARAHGYAVTADAPPAWEDPSIPFPDSLWRTWRDSVIDPGRFFPRVPWERPLARPVLYFLVVTVIGAFFTLWWGALGMVGSLPFAYPGGGVDAGAGVVALMEFFITPFAALFGLLIWTLVLHLFSLFLAPERRGLGATARALCYSAGPAVFSIVPFLGALVAAIWGLVLQVFGIRAAHRTTTGRAIAIVLLPLALLIAFFVTLFLLAVLILGVTLFGR